MLRAREVARMSKVEMPVANTDFLVANGKMGRCGSVCRDEMRGVEGVGPPWRGVWGSSPRGKKLNFDLKDAFW